MTRKEMIAEVEAEILRLERIRGIMAQSHSERFSVAQLASSGPGPVKKRVLSPEARLSIVQAQRRRWAKQKRESAGATEPK